MRLFNVSRRYVNGVEVLDGINLNLSAADVATIVKGLEKMKSDDVVEISCRTQILDSLKSLL